MDQVHKYKYLGSVVNEGIEISEPIQTIKGQAKSNFIKMKNVFCSRDISLTQKRGCYGAMYSQNCFSEWKRRKASKVKKLLRCGHTEEYLKFVGCQGFY